MAKEPKLHMAGDEDLERARAFWQANGRPIVGGILLGILAIGGWNGWQIWQQSEGEMASMLYENLLRQENAVTTAASVADELIQDYAKSPYAVNGALVMAKRAVQSVDYAEARRYLQWVVDNAQDEALRHIARLRLAQVAMEEHKPEAARRVLAQGGPAADLGPFAARYQELIGDAEAELGNEESARKAWESSLALLQVGSSSAKLVQLKLDNLGKL